MKASALAFLMVLPAFAQDWNPRLAADYLDARQKEWFEWPTAKRAGGPCVSCHTGVTYLLARPALRRVLGEDRPTRYETGLVDALRARLDEKVLPVSKEPKTLPNLGTESIFGALFLGEPAFDRLWSLQIADGSARGSWPWFEFNLDPFETSDSSFIGASLAALAVTGAPAEYRGRADVQPHIADLARFLKDAQSSQPLHNRLVLLWAAAALPDAITKTAQQAIIAETLRKQQPDGSWRPASLGPWKSHADAPAEDPADTYTTAVAAFCLQKAGVFPSDPNLARALDWLRAHQDRQSGAWAARSMNKRYPDGSMQVRFMQDAATAFAVLALTEAGPAKTKSPTSPAQSSRPILP